MKKRGLFFTAVIFTAAFFACDNFFHELIPPDENRIESFFVPGQLSVEIGNTAITAYVSPNTDLTGLIPSIRVSEGATLFPVTWEYAARAFNDNRTFGAAMELYTSGNMTDKIAEMIRSNKTFNRPVLDLPINFDYPVDFLVISGLGTIRQYKARVEIDTGEGKFNSFKFDKFYNPEAVRSAAGVIDKEAKTVTVDVSYPTENIASYQLTPSFETNGARVYLDGTELRSGASVINFLKPPDSSDLNNPAYRSQTKTLTLKRAGFADAEWTLIVNFSEDPDTSRAITDFRFMKALNPLISADCMAEIANNGNWGTIEVTVYYAGARPEELKASFISPGTVTVNDVTQISGYSTQDFSHSTPDSFEGIVRYVVTSRIGGNIRSYAVIVNFIPAFDPLPQITYFSFRTEQNPFLVSSSSALINHDSRLILIEAAYDGASPPVSLIPDFSATGTVTVNGVTQNSGVTRINFSSPVIYTVSNSSNPTLKREYRVEVKFVRSLSSAAEIETFTFYKADNPGLIADVSATVNQITGAITATLLFETPGGNRTLVPRWSAQGRVETNGVTQTSGTGRQFYAPQTYRVVSADGIFQKNYTVTIKEVNSRIYVRQNATGRNDGTNWQNAYRSVNDAASDTGRLPETILKEVWVAEGTYTPRSSFSVNINTSWIGGFTGNEASVSARIDPANHKPVITGDQGGGQRLLWILVFYGSSYGGVCSIENLVITSAENEGGGSGLAFNSSSYQGPVFVTLIIKGVDFIDIKSGLDGGAISVFNGTYGLTNNGGSNNTDVIMTDCSFSNTQTGESGGACDFSNNRYRGNMTVTINNCRFTNTKAYGSGGALSFFNGVNATVTNCTFINTSSSNNRGNAISFDDCGNVTQSGNTFTNVSSPAVLAY